MRAELTSAANAQMAAHDTFATTGPPKMTGTPLGPGAIRQTVAALLQSRLHPGVGNQSVSQSEPSDISYFRQDDRSHPGANAKLLPNLPAATSIGSPTPLRARNPAFGRQPYSG